jgi:hypothetical protein
MSVVVKTAGVGNVTERLPSAERRAAMQKASGVIETARIYVLTAGLTVLRKQRLEVA